MPHKDLHDFSEIVFFLISRTKTKIETANLPQGLKGLKPAITHSRGLWADEGTCDSHSLVPGDGGVALGVGKCRVTCSRTPLSSVTPVWSDATTPLTLCDLTWPLVTPVMSHTLTPKHQEWLVQAISRIKLCRGANRFKGFAYNVKTWNLKRRVQVKKEGVQRPFTFFCIKKDGFKQ